MNIKTIVISLFLMIQTSFSGENNANNNAVALAIQGDNLWRNELPVFRVDFAQLQALAERFVVIQSSCSKAEASNETASKN